MIGIFLHRLSMIFLSKTHLLKLVDLKLFRHISASPIHDIFIKNASKAVEMSFIKLALELHSGSAHLFYEVLQFMETDTEANRLLAAEIRAKVKEFDPKTTAGMLTYM